MGLLSSIKHFYETKYFTLLIISLLLVPAAFGVLLYSKATTGDYFQKGVSLKGGDTYTLKLDRAVNVQQLQDALTSAHPTADITVRGISELGVQTGLLIEVSDITEADLLVSLNQNGITLIAGTYSKESIGASLGEAFYQQTLIALVAAFILMALVVFITFRNPLPSFYVVLAVFSTTVETLAVLSFLGIKIGTPGIAALLMIIGYSVDTDILLTTRAMHRKDGPLMDRIYAAMKTGMVMTFTALVTTIVAYFLSNSEVIRQIMLILTIGLLFDLVNTWIQNVGILRRYLERKGEHHG